MSIKAVSLTILQYTTNYSLWFMCPSISPNKSPQVFMIAESGPVSQSVSLSLLSYSVTKAWFLTFVWQSDQVMIYDSLYCLTVWPRDGLSLLIVWQPDQVDCIHCLTVWPHDGLWLPIVWQSDQVMINDCFDWVSRQSAWLQVSDCWWLLICWHVFKQLALALVLARLTTDWLTD